MLLVCLVGSHWLLRAAFWEIQRSHPNVLRPQASCRENALTPHRMLWAVLGLSVAPACLPACLFSACLSLSHKRGCEDGDRGELVLLAPVSPGSEVWGQWARASASRGWG